MKIRDDMLKALEEASEEKVIGNSLEAFVTLVAKDEHTKSFLDNIPYLHQMFIVSGVSLVDEAEDVRDHDYVKLSVTEHPGEKCERRLAASETVREHIEHPSLCLRCPHIVE